MSASISQWNRGLCCLQRVELKSCSNCRGTCDKNDFTLSRISCYRSEEKIIASSSPIISSWQITKILRSWIIMVVRRCRILLHCLPRDVFMIHQKVILGGVFIGHAVIPSVLYFFRPSSFKIWISTFAMDAKLKILELRCLFPYIRTPKPDGSGSEILGPISTCSGYILSTVQL